MHENRGKITCRIRVRLKLQFLFFLNVWKTSGLSWRRVLFLSFRSQKGVNLRKFKKVFYLDGDEHFGYFSGSDDRLGKVVLNVDFEFFFLVFFLDLFALDDSFLVEPFILNHAFVVQILTNFYLIIINIYYIIINKLCLPSSNSSSARIEIARKKIKSKNRLPKSFIPNIFVSRNFFSKKGRLSTCKINRNGERFGNFVFRRGQEKWRPVIGWKYEPNKRPSRVSWQHCSLAERCRNASAGNADFARCAFG